MSLQDKSDFYIFVAEFVLALLIIVRLLLDRALSSLSPIHTLSIPTSQSRFRNIETKDKNEDKR